MKGYIWIHLLFWYINYRIILHVLLLSIGSSLTPLKHSDNLPLNHQYSEVLEKGWGSKIILEEGGFAILSYRGGHFV